MAGTTNQPTRKVRREVREQLKAEGKWEEFRLSRERERLEKLKVAWRDELERYLNESGESVSPAMLDYLVERYAASGRMPQHARPNTRGRV